MKHLRRPRLWGSAGLVMLAAAMVWGQNTEPKEIMITPIKVIATQAVDPAEHNKAIVEAREQKLAWTRDPLRVALESIPVPGDIQDLTVQMRSSPAENPDVAEVRVWWNGELGDSVRGRFYHVRLRRAPQTPDWSIESIRYGWSCWPGRGHEDFGVEMCI